MFDTFLFIRTMERHMRRCMPGRHLTMKRDELTSSFPNGMSKDMLEQRSFPRFHANKLSADRSLASQLAANRQLGTGLLTNQ